MFGDQHLRRVLTGHAACYHAMAVRMAMKLSGIQTEHVPPEYVKRATLFQHRRFRSCLIAHSEVYSLHGSNVGRG